MDKTVGVLGGGQLGRMLIEAANLLDIKVLVLDAHNCPASQVNGPSNLIEGNFKDPQAIRQLAKRVDVLTVEIEHVDTQALEDISNDSEFNVEIQPDWSTIRNIQDKFVQKIWLVQRSIPVSKFLEIHPDSREEDIRSAIQELGSYPVMLKARREAYDGRGNFVIKSESMIPEAIKALGGKALYMEEWVHFTMELAVMVVKTKAEPDADWESATLAFPVVQTVHEDSICKLVYFPPQVDQDTLKRAQEFARKAVAVFAGKGVFGVEMFLLKDGKILINEIAPRPHNSGHYTIEACPISQYQAHLRAILDLPINPLSLEADRAAVMLNILGVSNPSGHLELRSAALGVQGAAIHMYGKGSGRPGRKMGHITVTAKTLEEAIKNIKPLVDLADKMKS